MSSSPSSRGLVAITGANGTIGYNSVLYALQTGYTVRCIVRTEHAIARIKAGPSIQQFFDNIEFAIVPDNTVPDAYDEALKGTRYVVHIAGVWPLPQYHPDDQIYYPFITSMENTLSAAKKSGTVKRVVFTQAGAGLISTDDGELGTRMDKILNESIQPNPYAANLKPPLPSVHHAYTSAKAYCMQHLLSLRSTPNLPFSIAQVIPGTVIGPSELVTTAADALSQMDRMTRALLFSDNTPRYAFGFVHVRDCARVHIEALDEIKVPNEKIPDFFVAMGATEGGRSAVDLWNEVGDMIEREFPEAIEKGVFRVGRSNMPQNMPFRVDSGVTEDILFGGERISGLGESVREVAGWYLGLLEGEV